MHKTIVFLLLATSTLTYGGCFLQDADLVPQLASQEEVVEAAITYYKTDTMECKDLMSYLKSSDNPVKMAPHGLYRFTFKNDQSDLIYAIITSDHIRVFKAEVKDKELLDQSMKLSDHQ